MLFTRKAQDFETPAGSPERELFTGEVQPDGTITLVPAGTQDIHEYINSFKEETSIYNLLTRYERGDIDALNQRQGAYGDFTQFPKTRAEFLQQLIDSERLFASLSIEIQEKFDRDPMKFFAQAGTEEWMKTLGYSLEVKDGEIPVEDIQPTE